MHRSTELLVMKLLIPSKLDEITTKGLVVAPFTCLARQIQLDPFAKTSLKIIIKAKYIHEV